MRAPVPAPGRAFAWVAAVLATTAQLVCAAEALPACLPAQPEARSEPFVPAPTGCAMAHCQPTMADRVGMEAPATFQSSWVDASAAGSSQGLGCASDGSIAVCTTGDRSAGRVRPYLKAYDGAGKLLWDSGAALNSWAWTSGQLRGPGSAYDPASGRHLATLDLRDTLMDSPVASTPPTPRAGGATGSTSRPSSSWTTAAPRFFALRDMGSRPSLVWQYGRRPGGGSAAQNPRGGAWVITFGNPKLRRVSASCGAVIQTIDIDALVGAPGTHAPYSAMSIAEGPTGHPVMLVTARAGLSSAYVVAIDLVRERALWTYRVPGTSSRTLRLGPFPVVASKGGGRTVVFSMKGGVRAVAGPCRTRLSRCAP